MDNNRLNIVPFDFRRLTSKIYLLAILVTLTMICTSCKKFVKIAPPQNEVIGSEVFSNDKSAVSATVGLYSQMMSRNLYFMNGSMSVFTALSADEIQLTAPDQGALPFQQNAIPVNSSIIQNNIWRYAYIYIYQANAIIEGLSQSNGVSDSIKAQLVGEAKFVRAFCYFYLANLFGPVPLVTKTDYQENQLKPRISVDTIYQQIITDLQDAQQMLKPSYPSNGPVRSNKWAATALLARVYLYRKEYGKAETAASAVINSGDYSLESDLNKVFLSNSTETIWQLLPVSPYFNTAEGYTFIPSSATVVPNYVISKDLLQSFAPGDKRKTAWVDSNVVNGSTYYYPFKYKIARGQDKSEYNIVLRLAEQYLIRAECRANTGDISDAKDDLDKIRDRAGLPDAKASDKQSLISTIRHEWRIELFAEWGHRWFDLKRWGIIDQVLSKEKQGWQSSDKLYPIPHEEIMSNPNLKQNAGY